MLSWRVSVVVCHQAKIVILFTRAIFVRHERVSNWEPWRNYLDGRSKNEGQNHGSTFLEFTSHQCAMTAFKCLQKRDVVFGYERTTKVSFTKSSSQVDEEIMVLLHNWSTGGVSEDLCSRETTSVWLSDQRWGLIRVTGSIPHASRKNSCWC